MEGSEQPMNRREQWRPILDAQVQCWSAKSCDQLISELQRCKAYEVEYEGKRYQVEVTLLENTKEYVHVGVDVDDGTLPASFRPLATSFICRKQQ
jgi:hypothetical protein